MFGVDIIYQLVHGEIEAIANYKISFTVHDSVCIESYACLHNLIIPCSTVTCLLPVDRRELTSAQVAVSKALFWLPLERQTWLS